MTNEKETIKFAELHLSQKRGLIEMKVYYPQRIEIMLDFKKSWRHKIAYFLIKLACKISKLDKAR